MALFADPEQKKREQLIIALFIIGVAVQFYFYHSGVIGRVYQENIGEKEGMIILGGLAKYLHLFGGIAAAYLVSFLMYMLRFGTLITVILDFALQAAAYYFLIWIIGAFIVISSLLLIGVICIAVFVFFFESW